MAKIVALGFMFVDHTGEYFFIHDLWLRSIGRGAAPIFLFLAGYAGSYRFSREVFFLAVAMLVSNLAMGVVVEPLNILFTILMARGVLHWLEKRGKMIEKPMEWFICNAVFIFITCFFFQYGTLGMMFAIAGYMHRRPEKYAPATFRRFLMATFVAYALTFAFFFDLTPATFALMVPVLGFDYWLLSRLKVKEVKVSGVLETPLALTSYYSGYIYVIHLIVLSWITGFPI